MPWISIRSSPVSNLLDLTTHLKNMLLGLNDVWTRHQKKGIRTLEFLIESTFQLTHSCTMRNLNEVLLSRKAFLSIFYFFWINPLLSCGTPKLDFFYFATNKGKSEMLVIARRWSFWYMLFFCYHMLDMRTNNQILKQK
jgi:hypothetical protein